MILTLLWGLVVLGSFVALGRLLCRAFDPTLLGDEPLAAGLGMAGMVFVVGVLNLAHMATTGVLVTLVVALISLEALVVFKSRGRPAPGKLAAGEAIGSDRGVAAAAAIGLFLVVLSLRYILSLGHPINQNDDQAFYLPQTFKLLQTGTLGAEPYLFRQMFTLNGTTVLSALGCCVAPPEYAYVVDPGLCWIILGGLIYTFLRRDLRLPIHVAALLGTVSLLFRIPIPNNIAGLLCGPVLLLTAARMMFTGGADSAALAFGRLVLTALVLSSLASMKPNYLIFSCLFVGSWSLLTLWRRGAAAIVRQVLPIAVLIALFTLPWMIQQYLSSGTPLYPILGKGYLFANHGFPFELHDDTLGYRLRFLVHYTTRGYSVAPPLTLIAVALLFARSPSALSQTLLATSMSVVLGSYLICFLCPLFSVVRYTISMLYISCLLPGLVGLTLAVRGDRLGLVLGCAFIMFLGNQWQDGKLDFARKLWARAHGEKTPGPEYAAKIRQAQSLTEPGKRILAAASSGFLFDYHRNPIWNFDFMGFMSPPPGLPLTADWKKLEAFLDRKSADPAPPGPVAEFRDFLVRSGVDYLFFERDPSFVYYLKDLPYWTYIDYALISIARLTHKNLLNLARDRHAVFDDGNMIMLDLRQGRLPDDPPFIDSGAVFGVSRSLQEEGRRAEREDN